MGFAKQKWMEEAALCYSDVPDKYVCPMCFDDYAIQAFITKNAINKSCSYCSSNSTRPISTPLKDVVDFICQGIITEWDDPANCMGWEGREGGWQGATVYHSDELIRSEIEELWKTNEKVLDDIAFSMVDSEWCQRDPYGLRKEEALSLSWKDFAYQVKHRTRYIFLRLKDKQTHLFESDMIPASIMLDRISKEISKLDKDISLTKVINIREEIFRARIHDKNKILTTAEELGTVPLKKAVYSNRMSPAGVPMFYGALDSETAFYEIVDDEKDKRGKVASIAKFITLREIRVLDLTSLPQIPSLFDPQQRHLRSPLIFLRDFVNELSQPITKDRREHIEYVPTQAFTEYIRYMHKDLEGHDIEGILYPSSKKIEGISCVLFIENEQCCDESQGDINGLGNSDDSEQVKYLFLDGQVQRLDLTNLSTISRLRKWLLIKLQAIPKSN